MISRKYGAWVVYGVCVVMALSMVGCAAFMSGFEHGRYEDLGWIRVDKNDPAKISGYKRLIRESDCSRIVKKVVEDEGLPDYLNNPDLFVLYLAYIKEGVVYKLDTSASNGGILAKDNYRYSDDLPDFLIKKFVAVELRNRSRSVP